MDYFILIPLLFCIILIISIILLCQKNKKINKQLSEIQKAKGEELKSYFEKEWKNQEGFLQNQINLKNEELQKQEKLLTQHYNTTQKYLNDRIDSLQKLLTEKERRYLEVNQDLDLYKQGKLKEIDSAAAEYEKRQQLIIEKAIDIYRSQLTNHINEYFEVLEEEKENRKKEIDEIGAQLEVERRKRAAVNEEIKRARELEEKQDFYRIQLDTRDKDDIEVLKSIAPRLRHPEAINKVIWSNYYQKPLAELRKRVGIEDSGVYKITRLKTGEIYIGQAVNISSRWSDHCKAALGVGTLASSQLHRVMAEDGCENFLFEVLEKVPKDKLKERESYYIDFYDSKNYGLNSISGKK